MSFSMTLVRISCNPQQPLSNIIGRLVLHILTIQIYEGLREERSRIGKIPVQNWKHDDHRRHHTQQYSLGEAALTIRRTF